MDLIPRKATYRPGEPIAIDIVDRSGPVTVELWHLDRLVDTLSTTDGDVSFPSPGIGGYGVEARDSAGNAATTAVDVLADPFDRPRYGFVADFPAGHTPDALVETAKRLHLNMIQFYDWAHRYAQLVPDEPDYIDPLGRRLSLDTVRAMTGALADTGSQSMGYAAVYAVGGVDWADWEHAGLFKADGAPHRFTDDLLLVVDPSNPAWMKHFAADLRQSMTEVGFTGFHLDSYGWPKRAYRADGSVADLNDGFATLLEHLRDDVPGGRLLFNNVNDFPTWSTAKTRQDGTYIEVWAPHSTLGHLAGLVDRARASRNVTPILAAYLSVYRDAPTEAADTTARLTMATIFSHGGTHLLNGEGNTLLIDPYYPTNHTVAESTTTIMRTWYDFLVRYGDLLLDPAAVDVTRSYTGGINEDIIISAATGGVRVSTDPEPGTIWARVVRTPLGLVLHFINLAAQEEIGWDTPKRPVAAIGGVTIRVLKALATGRPLIANPDGDQALQPLDRTSDELYDVITVPELGAWTMVVLPHPERWDVGPRS